MTRFLASLVAFLVSASVFANSQAFTSSVDDIGEFFDVPDSMRGDQSRGRQADAAAGRALAVALPGSSETYDAVYYISDRTWNVYTNGVHVLTNETVTLVSNTDPLVGGVYLMAYELYDQLQALGLPVTSLNNYQPWQPNLFEFLVFASGPGGEPVRVRFKSSGGKNLETTSEITGTYCYQPKAARLSAGTVAGVLSSYDAYFERLYYASEGNERDYGEEWGPNAAGNDFPFNLTNDEYSASCYFDFAGINVNTGDVRRIPDTRKIADCLDLANFQTNVLVNMLSTEGVSTGIEKPVNPGYIYRPKGVLDASEPTNGTTWVWWASRDNPPKWYYEHSIQCVQDPETDGFGFFPTFGWMSDPLRNDNGYQRYDWPTRCVTMHMAVANNPTHPARKLFELVCGDDSCSLDLEGFVKPYRFGTTAEVRYPLVEWMTNVYPMAGKAYTDRSSAFNRYLLTSGAAVYGNGPLRRILPNDYVGVNHVLASMNRTIMIPNMTLVTTNEYTDVTRIGEYSLTLPMTYNIYPDGRVKINGSGQGEGTLPKTGETNAVTRYKYGYDGGFSFETSSTDHYLNSSDISGTCHGDIWIDQNWLETHGRVGSNEIEIVSIVGANSNFVTLEYLHNGTNVTENVYCSVSGAQGDVTVLQKVSKWYHTDLPWHIYPRLGPTQPGATGADRVKSGRCAVLSRLKIDGDDQYRSDENANFATREGLRSSVATSLAAMKASLKSKIMEKNGGFDYDNMNAYAPLPSSFFLRWFLGDEQVVSFNSNPITAHPEKTIAGDWWLIFANVTNVVTFQHWKNFYISETETKTYDVTVTVYEGSGLVASNVVETGSSVTPSGYGEEDAGTIPVGNEENIGEYRAGPFAVLPDTVEVPDYQQHNTVPITRNFRVTTKFGDYTVTTTWRSGTGEYDPGEVNSNATETASIFRGVEQTELDIVVGETEIGDPFVDQTRTVPSEDAIRTEGGNFEVRGDRHIVYNRAADGTVSGITSFIRWYKKQTGEFYEDEGDIFPLKIGELTCTLRMDLSVTWYSGLGGGCSTPVQGSGNSKAITQVDWRFKNLRKD